MMTRRPSRPALWSPTVSMTLTPLSLLALLTILTACATTSETRPWNAVVPSVPFRGGLPAAKERLDRGDVEGAMRVTEEHLSLSPDDPSAHYTRGTLLLGKGRWVDARDALARAVAIEPDNAGAWNNLGIAQTELHERKAAEASFRKAAGLRAEDPTPWVNLGNVHARSGRYADAREAYDEALFRDPQDQTLAIAHAGVLIRSGGHEQAVETLESAMQTFGETPEGLSTLAAALRGLGRGQEALVQSEKALALAPDSPAVLLCVAMSLDFAERPEAALAYERAVTAAAGTGVEMGAVYNRALYAMEKGDKPLATELLTRYLELEPGDTPEHHNVVVLLDRLAKETPKPAPPP